MRWRRQIWIVGFLLLAGVLALSLIGIGEEVEYQGETTLELPPGAEMLSAQQSEAFRSQVTLPTVTAAAIAAGLRVEPGAAENIVVLTYAAPSRYEVERVLRIAKGSYLAAAWPVHGEAYEAFVRASQAYDVTAAVAAEPGSVGTDPARQELVRAQAEARATRDTTMAELVAANEAATRALSGRVRVRGVAGEGRQGHLMRVAGGIVAGGFVVVRLISRFLSWHGQRRKFAW